MHTWEVPAAAAKLLQSCPTLCNPMDCSPPGSLSMGFSRQEYWSGVPLPSAGRFLRYTKYGVRTRQTKMIGQRKPGSNSDYHEGATRSPSPQACVPTHTVFFFLLINTLLVSLFSIFVGILFWKPKGPGPCHWRTHPVDRIQCLLPWRDLNLWPGTETLLQAALGQGHLRPVKAMGSASGRVWEDEPVSPLTSAQFSPTDLVI